MYFPGTEDKVVNNQDRKSSFFTELIMRDMSHKQINRNIKQNRGIGSNKCSEEN